MEVMDQLKKEYVERKKVIEAITAIVSDTAYEQIPNLRFNENLRRGLAYVDEYIRDVYDAFISADINKKEKYKNDFGIIEDFINNNKSK